MTQKQERRTHLTMTLGETYDGEYSRCSKCGEKTILITAPTYWNVDSEPFKADEKADENQDTPTEVDVHDEISAHYCNSCYRITSLSFNESI